METKTHRSEAAEFASRKIDPILAKVFDEIGVDENTVVVDLVDIDNTAITPSILVSAPTPEEDAFPGFTHFAPPPNFISPVMVDALKRSKRIADAHGATHAGFCLETHRGLVNEFVLEKKKDTDIFIEEGSAGASIHHIKYLIYNCKRSDSDRHIDHSNKEICYGYSNVDTNDIITPCVAENLAKQSNMECLAIGTLDDMFPGRRFGQGYQENKPWYDHLIQSKKSISIPPHAPLYSPSSTDPYKFYKPYLILTKNEMHVLAEEEMHRRFPGKKIVMIFHDDKDSMTQGTRMVQFKHETAIVVFKHDAFDQTLPRYLFHVSNIKTPACELASTGGHASSEPPAAPPLEGLFSTSAFTLSGARRRAKPQIQGVVSQLVEHYDSLAVRTTRRG